MKNRNFFAICAILAILSLVFVFSIKKTTAAQWWDKYGEPEYGGSITFIGGVLQNVFDPGQLQGGWQLQWEALFNRDWTTDPNIWNYDIEFCPIEFYKGGLAKSWEQTSPTTVTVRIHEGITWQNRPPLNGRELTAEDVQYTFDRVLGTGSGFTKPNMMLAGFFIPSVKQVIAKDKYTVEFILKNESAFSIWDVLNGGFSCIPVVAHELVEQDLLKDWKTAIGSGPWIIDDFQPDSYAKYIKNPEYWNFDERHPKNRLPYADTCSKLVIPDMATALAGLRTGKIDLIYGSGSFPISDTQVESVIKSNPEMKLAYNAYPNIALEMRVDHEPFTDIRVRKALQMSVDLNAIAKSISNGALSGMPIGLISPAQKEYFTPFKDWPADLQKEYSYNVPEAKRLMAEAGYPNGFKTNVVSPVANRDMLVIFKSYFMEIGVDMEINALTDQTSSRNFLQAGKHDALAASQTAGITRAPHSLLQQRLPNNRDNYSKCNDPVYNEMVKKALSTSDLKEAQRLCREADLYQLAQHWSITTFANRMPKMWQPYLKGYNGEFVILGMESFYFSRLWIDNSMKKSMGR